MSFDKKQIEILERLFPNKIKAVDFRLLEIIYTKTDNMWNDNIEKRLRNRKVKYLWFAEAPPSQRAKDDRIRYFYNENLCYEEFKHSQILAAVWSGLFHEKKPKNRTKILDRLASEGFLLVDTIPFALKYNNKRRNPNYVELIRSNMKDIMKKLNDKRIEWSDYLKIGFVYKNNRNGFIEAFGGSIDINCRRYELRRASCFNVGSNKPSKKKIEKFFLR
jgi:hypothetical protein